jgi:hypothetical protein
LLDLVSSNRGDTDTARVIHLLDQIYAPDEDNIILSWRRGMWQRRAIWIRSSPVENIIIYYQ